MLNGFYFILGQDVAAHFDKICTNVLDQVTVILEINK